MTTTETRGLAAAPSITGVQATVADSTGVAEEDRQTERLQRKNRQIARLQAELARERAEPFDASRIVWIFGSSRTGSTWLTRMLGELPGGTVWSEPVVGALFGEFYFDRFPHRRGAHFLFADRFKPVWLRGIRSMVLDGAEARCGSRPGYVAINEPHGSVGAALLSEALPESRVVLLVRDPRDVVASVYDAHRTGGFATAKPWHDPSRVAERHPTFISSAAKTYLWNLEHACDAFSNHPGPRALVRYEDLRRDTVSEFSRLCSELGLAADREAQETAVATHDWDAISEEKGRQSFYRKASPGSWVDDLDPSQIETVEEICEPVLAAFYDGEMNPALLRPGEYDRVPSARVLWERVQKAEAGSVHRGDSRD